jgi:hypothetical protein
MEINAVNNLAASMADMGQMLRAAIAEGEQAQQTAAGIDTYA